VGLVTAGKVTARIVEMDVEWQVSEQLPVTPIYKNQRGANFLLQAGAPPFQIYFSDRLLHVIVAEQQEITIKRKVLWVYGYVSYRDLLETTTDIGFVYQWSLGSGAIDSLNGFIGFGPLGYVYERKRPTSETK
jgi:hypothetical protein